MNSISSLDRIEVLVEKNLRKPKQCIQSAESKQELLVLTCTDFVT